MRDMGEYEILSCTAMLEWSIRIIGMKASERVVSHCHEKGTQIYTVLEHEGRIQRGTVHSIRAVDGSALVLGLSTSPWSGTTSIPRSSAGSASEFVRLGSPRGL